LLFALRLQGKAWQLMRFPFKGADSLIQCLTAGLFVCTRRVRRDSSRRSTPRGADNL
jgi:hypothetical protein